MPKVTDAFLDDVRKIVNYNWTSEEVDYIDNCSNAPGENQREGHIFETLKKVVRVLDRIKDEPRKLRYVCIASVNGWAGYYGVGASIKEAVEVARKAGMRRENYYVQVTDSDEITISDVDGGVGYYPTPDFPRPKYASMRIGTKVTVFDPFVDELPKLPKKPAKKSKVKRS